MKTIKYRIIFEGEMSIGDNLSEEEIRDEIAREFYEEDCDAFDASLVEWEVK